MEELFATGFARDLIERIDDRYGRLWAWLVALLLVTLPLAVIAIVVMMVI